MKPSPKAAAAGRQRSSRMELGTPLTLLGAGCLVSAFNFVNVLALHIARDPLMYSSDAVVLLLASICVGTLRGETLPRVVLTRKRLWAASLACYACAFLWCAALARIPQHGISHVIILLYAATYSLAFLAVVSPPSGRRWDRHGILDYLQAILLGAMFFQTSLYLDKAFDHLAFSAVLQMFLGTAALLAGRAARSEAERRFTLFMGIYFVVTALLGLFSNVADALGMHRMATFGDAIYPLDSLTALALAYAMHVLPLKRPGRPSYPTTTMPVLTTGAILLLCIPILRAHLNTGMALLGAAFVLFSIRISIILTLREAERRTLYQANEELRRLALTDPLTGAANRRAFTEALQRAVQQAASTGPAFTLVLLDMDNLKTINDTQGHQAGDQAIQTVAAALRETLKESPFEHAARLGGDEFAAILPVEVDAAAWIASLRLVVAQHGLGFSAGAVHCTLAMNNSAEELIQLADTRLYEEKQSRRALRMGHDLQASLRWEQPQSAP